ncbi:hypothetical protein FG386_002691 [Cryptosporidium ryanae]|uniref:uncharacterized protein n=1 Tax=Cryptosporidium ryanae TaxID=515981 RepID=UPI00351AAC46|nr:hypothetical protein FG386_002691 [Cryptosporidium ryanae]
MSNSKDENDILDEYEVILSHINDVSFHIFQFPMTSSHNCPEKVWKSAFIRPDGGSFQLSYYSNDNSDVDVGNRSNNSEDFKSNVSQERSEFIENNYLYTINSKSCLSSSNSLVIGYFDHENKKLFITPISTVQQFRPNFSVVDQNKIQSTSVGVVERYSCEASGKDKGNRSLDNLILNHGNTQTGLKKSGRNSESDSMFGNKYRFYTTGVENWIKIPCIHQNNSYESREVLKILTDIEFDDFISWKNINLNSEGSNSFVKQLYSRCNNRKRIHYFNNDQIKYLKILSGIASDGNTEFNLPFRGNGQVLPSTRTSGLPKIYTAYQYPPSSPTSSLGGCTSYNFGNIEDSGMNSIFKNIHERNENVVPFHGISGKLLSYDDWLFLGPISIQELHKMDISEQVQRITLVYQVIPFYGIKLLLKRVYYASKLNNTPYSEVSNIKLQEPSAASSNHKSVSSFPSDDELIVLIRKYCVLVSGNWVYRSELLYNEYESCCRDLILVLLQRDENAGLNREPIRVATDLPQIKVTNMLREVSVYRSTAWYPKFPIDRKFIEEHIEEATYWKNYWLDREKHVVQYIRENRDTSTSTLTYLNNSSATLTSISNSQLQLLLIFALKTYGAMNSSELLNVCTYHLTLMSVGNAALTTVPSSIGGQFNSNTVSGSKISDSSHSADQGSLTYSRIGGSQNKAGVKSGFSSSTSFSGIYSTQNFIAPTFSPFSSSYIKHNIRQIQYINVNSNLANSVKINIEDIKKSLEKIAISVFEDIWVLKSVGDSRFNSIRRIVINHFNQNIVDKEDVFTITSFIDSIKQNIINNCKYAISNNELWYDYCGDNKSSMDDEGKNTSQLLRILNNVPEFIWRNIIHEFAFPINETATVWKLKSK